jgi:3-dehydroquinate synthetase
VDDFARALKDDKKKKAGKTRFIVPAERGAVIVTPDEAQCEGIIEDMRCSERK